MSETLVAAVGQQRAHVVIFDITGVPFIETQVAQTIVALGLDFHTIRAFANLEEAVSKLIQPRDETSDKH